VAPDTTASVGGRSRDAEPPQAGPRSARSLIPRNIFWLITKLTGWVGSTISRAHDRAYA
jgi:hypothetical protein